MTIEEFFAGFPESRVLFDAVWAALQPIGPAQVRVSKSQIAFWNRTAFAWVWVPARYLHGKTAPLVLSLAFRARKSSSRWKQVVEPHPGQFMHHLELYSAGEVDEEVLGWLREAWLAAE